MGEASKRGEIRVINGRTCRFIERELEGDKWEDLGPARMCDTHPDRPSRTNLDGDELCQECADAWVRGEGEHQAWLDAQEQEGKAPHE